MYKVKLMKTTQLIFNKLGCSSATSKRARLVLQFKALSKIEQGKIWVLMKTRTNVYQILITKMASWQITQRAKNWPLIIDWTKNGKNGRFDETRKTDKWSGRSFPEMDSSVVKLSIYSALSKYWLTLKLKSLTLRSSRYYFSDVS